MRNLNYSYCSVSLLNNAQGIDDSPFKKIVQKKGCCYNKIFFYNIIARSVGVPIGVSHEKLLLEQLACQVELSRKTQNQTV